jgi:hypothetical protein
MATNMRTYAKPDAHSHCRTRRFLFAADSAAASTDEQIDGAADCTLAACGPQPSKLALLKQLRRQCVFRKGDAAKAAKWQAPKPKPKGILRYAST